MLLADLICVGIGVAGVAPWKHLPNAKLKPKSHYYLEIVQNDKNKKHYLVVQQRGQQRPWPKEILKYEANHHNWSKPVNEFTDADISKTLNWPNFWPYEIKDDTTDEELCEWIAEISMKIEEWETIKPGWDRAKELLNAYG